MRERIFIAVAGFGLVIAILVGYVGGCKYAEPQKPATGPLTVSEREATEKFEAAQIRLRWRNILGPKKRGPGDPEQGFETLNTPENQEYIQAATTAYGIPADIIQGLLRVESAGDTDVVSTAACVGIAQFYASTARDYGLNVNRPLYLMQRAEQRKLQRELERTPQSEWQLRAALRNQIALLDIAMRQSDERTDPEKSIMACARHLKRLQGVFGGRLDFAIAAYHMGEGTMKKVLELYTWKNRRFKRYRKVVAKDGKETFEQLGDGDAWEFPHISPTITQNGLTWSFILKEVTAKSHPATHAKLASLKDESRSYYWKVMAASQIFRLYQEDRIAFHVELKRRNPGAYQARHGRLSVREASLSEKWSKRTRRSVVLAWLDNPAVRVALVVLGANLLYWVVVACVWWWLPRLRPYLRERPWSRAIFAWAWWLTFLLLAFAWWQERPRQPRRPWRLRWSRFWLRVAIIANNIELALIAPWRIVWGGPRYWRRWIWLTRYTRPFRHQRWFQRQFRRRSQRRFGSRSSGR